LDTVSTSTSASSTPKATINKTLNSTNKTEGGAFEPMRSHSEQISGGNSNTKDNEENKTGNANNSLGTSGTRTAASEGSSVRMSPTETSTGSNTSSPSTISPRNIPTNNDFSHNNNNNDTVRPLPRSTRPTLPSHKQRLKNQIEQQGSLRVLI